MYQQLLLVQYLSKECGRENENVKCKIEGCKNLYVRGGVYFKHGAKINVK